MTMLETLDKLHPDLISHFLATGQCDGIPEDVKAFLKQLQWAAEIYESQRSISKAAKELQVRIAGEQMIKLDVRTCMARIYAAINYFSINNNVSTKVWEDNYADKFEELAAMAEEKGDYKTANKCLDKARECRIRASEADQADRQWAPVFIISPEITPEDLGYSKRNLKEIARKSNEGYYINLIESLPIEKEEKSRLLRDAGIIEVEAEEIIETGE